MSFAYFKSKPSNSMYYVLRYLLTRRRTLANRKRNQANTSVCALAFLTDI